MAAFFEDLGEIPFGYQQRTGFWDFRPLAYSFDEPRIERPADRLHQALDAARDEPYRARVTKIRERFETVAAWARLARASREVQEALALPEEERKPEEQAKALQRLKGPALPCCLHLAARKDPSAQKPAGRYRRRRQSDLWEPFGEEPAAESDNWCAGSIARSSEIALPSIGCRRRARLSSAARNLGSILL